MSLVLPLPSVSSPSFSDTSEGGGDDAGARGSARDGVKVQRVKVTGNPNGDKDRTTRENGGGKKRCRKDDETCGTSDSPDFYFRPPSALAVPSSSLNAVPATLARLAVPNASPCIGIIPITIPSSDLLVRVIEGAVPMQVEAKRTASK